MSRTLVIACGALARELVAVLRASGWERTDVSCLPASWHNTPERIVPAVEEKILAARATHDRVLVAYGDCGTGGRLDAMLARHGVPRLPGAHCYAFFAGLELFDALADDEPGTFYLTDYLARNFERLVLDELGIRRHPELLDMYFGNYTRVVYLAQGAPGWSAARTSDASPDALAEPGTVAEAVASADAETTGDAPSPRTGTGDEAVDEESLRAARAAAAALGLPLEVRRTGLEPFDAALRGIRIVAAPGAPVRDAVAPDSSSRDAPAPTAALGETTTDAPRATP